MDTPVNSQICYGIKFDGGYKFPWNITCLDNTLSIEDALKNWWAYDVCGYKPPLEIFDRKTGGWIDGKERSNEIIKKYFDDYYFFLADHRLHYSLVNYLSLGYPMYILAIEETLITANRMSPEFFDPTDLVVIEEERLGLIHFCQTHGIETTDEPRWWLSVSWS